MFKSLLVFNSVSLGGSTRLGNVSPLLSVLSNFSFNQPGWLLSPVLVGLVIDGVCRVWDATCGVAGRCLLYDNNLLRLKLHGYAAVAIGLALLCTVVALAYGTLRPPANFDTVPSDRDKSAAEVMLSRDKDDKTGGGDLSEKENDGNLIFLNELEMRDQMKQEKPV